MENTSRQLDEVEALKAIYEDDIVSDGDTLLIDISGVESDMTVKLELRLPEDYPEKSPPTYTISAPWMSRKRKNQLMHDLNEIFLENIGEPIIYMWIEKIRDFLSSNITSEVPEVSENFDEDEDNKSKPDVDIGSVEIFHGEPLLDRRSAFQAHVAKVHSLNEVKIVIEKLKENKKIATATHNISAYRLMNGPHGTCIQDCDDDGETHAGGRLLHLLQILDVNNVVVVVSRWFGGIQLGPDRFKHINNVARELLEKSGFINTPDGQGKESSKDKKKKSK